MASASRSFSAPLGVESPKSVASESLAASRRRELAELQQIAKVLQSGDATTARMLWASTEARKAQRRHLLLGDTSSSSSLARQRRTSQEDGSIASTDSMNLSIDSAGKKLMELSRRKSIVDLAQSRRQSLRRKSCSYPENVLLRLEESQHALEEDLRHSITYLNSRIEETKQATKMMRSDEKKFEMLFERFEVQALGKLFSDPGGKKTVLRSSDFDPAVIPGYVETKERNKLEKEAMNAELQALEDKIKAAEILIFEVQRPKIQLLKKHLEKLQAARHAATGGAPVLSRATVLTNAEKYFTVAELLQLAKQKEAEVKEKKKQSLKQHESYEKQLTKMDTVLQGRMTQLQQMRRDVLVQESIRRKRELLGDSRSRSNSPILEAPLPTIVSPTNRQSPRQSPRVEVRRPTPVSPRERQETSGYGSGNGSTPRLAAAGQGPHSSSDSRGGTAGEDEGVTSDASPQPAPSSPKSTAVPSGAKTVPAPQTTQVVRKKVSALDTTLVVDDPTLAALASAIEFGGFRDVPATITPKKGVDPVLSRSPVHGSPGPPSPAASTLRRSQNESQRHTIEIEEETMRLALRKVEREALRVLKTSYECELLDLKLKERTKGRAHITFTENGRPVVRDRRTTTKGEKARKVLL
jgi:hypothetical protein